MCVDLCGLILQTLMSVVSLTMEDVSNSASTLKAATTVLVGLGTSFKTILSIVLVCNCVICCMVLGIDIDECQADNGGCINPTSQKLMHYYH